AQTADRAGARPRTFPRLSGSAYTRAQARLDRGPPQGGPPGAGAGLLYTVFGSGQEAGAGRTGGR
ncbi:MAG TPA: hypothetical protein VHN78_12410, partial [Chloroflexota bacterium]|nr:hypothetical protein [Chloroflexota bacterium]